MVLSFYPTYLFTTLFFVKIQKKILKNSVLVWCLFLVSDLILLATFRCPLCFLAEWTLGSNAIENPIRPSKLNAAMTSAVFAANSARIKASDPRDEINWVPLIKARPSFGFKSRVFKLWWSKTFSASVIPKYSNVSLEFLASNYLVLLSRHLQFHIIPEQYVPAGPNHLTHQQFLVLELEKRHLHWMHQSFAEEFHKIFQKSLLPKHLSSGPLTFLLFGDSNQVRHHMRDLW